MAYQPEIEKLEQRYAAEPARNFAQLAEAYRRDGRLDQALDILHMHLQERPDYVSGLVVLGRCLVEKQEDTEAQATFEHVLMLDAEHIIALKALADISGRANDSDGARNWLQRLLDVDPMNEDAQAGLDALAAAAPAEEVVQEPAASPSPSSPPEAMAPSDVEEEEPEPPPIPPTVAVPAVDVLAESEELVIERASAEYDVVAADLAPVEVEQSSEAALPPLPEVVDAEPEPEVEDDLDATAPMFASGPEPGDAGPEESESTLAEPPPQPLSPDMPVAGDTVIEEAIPEPAEAGDLDLEPFDSNLGWGTGERISRQITSEDIVAAELAHEDALEDAAVQELPGMENADVPPVGHDAAAEGPKLETTATPTPPEGIAEPVAGLEPEEFEPVDSEGTTPLEGLEPTSEDATTIPDLGTDGIVTFGSAETVRLEGIDAPASTPASDLGFPATEEETVWVEPEEPTPTAQLSAPVAEPALESGEAVVVPDEVVEPVPVDETPPEDGESKKRSSLDGLPVFMPDDDEESAPTGEPEPVVTETMAEVYARQGLIDEARDVYRKLLDARPNDPRLQDRLAALDAQPAAEAGAGTKTDRYSAAAIGGESARSFLRSILSGHVGESPSAQAAPASVAPVPVEATPAATPAPSPIDEAFEGEDADTAPGAPTQPASDEMSLSNVFGDAPAPAAPEVESETPETAPGAGAPGGFSFDEFFGSRPGGRRSTGEHRPPRDTMSDDEGDEAFRNWLKGLKG